MNAREYYEEHLCVGDYYDEGRRVSGEWQGLGVERLGLVGRVLAGDFLCTRPLTAESFITGLMMEN